jgi:integrase
MSGHIRRSGKVSWELKFSVDGKPQYRSFKGTKREAIAELTRLTASAINGTYIDGSRLTVAEFLDRWMRDWAEVHNSPKTRQNNTQLIQVYVKPHLGAVPLQKLKPLHLSELYAALLREGGSDGSKLSATTVGNVHRVLKNALRHAVRWGLILKTPAADISPPRNDADEIEVLSEGDAKALLERLRGTSLCIVAVLGLTTGMRRGEMCALRWGDVDLAGAGGIIKVERSLEQSKLGGMRIKSPKTKAGRRAISIPPAVVEELRKHRLAQQERWLALGLGKITDDTTVLATAFGEMRSADSLSRDWCALKAGTLHSLRHSHASQLISAGMDVVSVSRRLGHAKPTVTLRIYAHLYAPKDDQAAAIVGQSFSRML